jgi:hypothetical protein
MPKTKINSLAAAFIDFSQTGFIFKYINLKEGKRLMKAAIVFTGSGPLVILTSYESFTDPKLVAKLNAKGIRKYMGFELPVELCQKRYGEHYPVVINDLRQTDDLRVLDYDGHHVFLTFSFSEYGNEFKHE